MPINNADEAKAVARLIQQGMIVGPARDVAIADLRAFDTGQSSEPASAPLVDPKKPFFNKEALAGAAEVGMASVMGMAETAARLEEEYVSGKSPAAAADVAHNYFGYDVKTKDGQDLAKVLGYIPEKMRKGVVDVASFWGGENAGHHAGNVMDAAMLGLAGKGGYKGAKTPKAIGLHEHLGSVRELHDAGVPMTLAERSPTLGAGAVGALSDATNAVRDSGWALKRLQKFTEVALKNAGIKGNAVVPEVMGPRAAELGAKFDAYDAAVNIQDRNFNAAIVPVEQAAHDFAPANAQAFISRFTDQLRTQMRNNHGILPGRAMKEARTAIEAASGDPTLKTYATKLREALDQAMEASAPQDLVAEIRQTRSSWRAMKDIEEAAAGNPRGLITPDSFFNTFSNKENLPGTIYGRGETANHRLARAGANVFGAGAHGGAHISAIPRTAVGVASQASRAPSLTLGVVGGITGARKLNENSFMAKALGGKGRTQTSRMPNKKELLGIYYSANTPEKRKAALKDIQDAFATDFSTQE